MARHAFPRELRLLTPAQFKNVFDNPVRAASPHLTLLAKPNESGHPRLGLAVPKKALKRAVWRNRVKRVVRESFRLRQHRLPAVDIVVIAKQGIGDVPNDELFELLDRLWRTLSRRCNGSA
ncbi:ribonuclease P protein component [Zobellella denitrificans]|jgi:ribonuclease P protein component|uniref:Ribonuclease P protein component n=1 Tax=Zobellella denitrificans TaxID=347534 RepID=A0A231N101_9GAMM|nr:ribonuclease P protein component [Zobellella denitrificans]ATG75736.1 ribonuclease P [Zobellella denitrificans]OXS16153.1 ribonuclease P protein component [Zobellella denitrificans]